MKRERLVILLGALVALVFFYLGLNTWLKSKEEKVIPPPVVIKPQPKEEKAQEQQVQQEKPEAKPLEEKKDEIAQKIEKEKKVAQLPERTEKKTTEPKPKSEEKKAYIIQIGAFSKEENAKKALKKAKDMGYEGKIDKEGELYKVRIKVVTASIEKDMSKLKSAFGGAVLKR